MYNKNNIAIAKIASKSSIKLELACVAMYGNRTVATDGFKLVEMSATGEAHPLVLFNAEHLKSTVKLKKGETITEKDVPLKEIGGENFPDVDIILRQFKQVDDPESYTSINLSAEYLEQVLSVVKNLNAFKQVTLSVPTGPRRPILITAECKNKGIEQTARALVMPHNR